MDISHELSVIGLTDEQYEECINLIIDKKQGNTKIEWQEIIDKFDLPFSVMYLRKACTSIFGGAFVAQYFQNKKEIEDNKILIDKDITTNVETSMNKDGSWSSKRLMIMNEEQSKDSNFILNAHGFNPLEWQIVSLRNNIRQVISKQDGVVTLYASFLTVKPINGLTKEQVEEFYKELIKKYPSPVVKKHDSVNDGVMLEIPIQDVQHIMLQYLLGLTYAQIIVLKAKVDL